MGSRLDAVLIVGVLLGILSSSTTHLASGLSEASECIGQLGPPSGSTAKPQVTWRLDNASTGVAKFVVSRYVAYSGAFKYVSLAFASSNQMPSTNLIIDCYEKSSGPQIATSRNLNYTNLPDSRLSSRILSTSASKVDTSLSCSFLAKMQPDANFIFMATGAMSAGLKNKHAEKYVFATSEMQCLLEAAAQIVIPTTARAGRSTMAKPTTVTKASDLSPMPLTVASDVSPFGAIAKTTSATSRPTKAELPTTFATLSSSAVATGTSNDAVDKSSTLSSVTQSLPAAGTSSRATTQNDFLSAQLWSWQQSSRQPEVRVSPSSLRSTTVTQRILTSSTTPWIGDVMESDYSATPEQFEPLDASNNEQAPSTSAATTRRLGSSSKEPTSAAGNRPKYVSSTTGARQPDSGQMASATNGGETKNLSLPNSAAPGAQKDLAKGTASSYGDHATRLLCMAVCLCGAYVLRFACGDTLPAMRNLLGMLT